jgi:hypothetical protein
MTPLTWQRIATAPKDGTLVLLWWEVEFRETVIAYWACGSWFEGGDGSHGWTGESFHASVPDTWTRLLGERPTHWMPLPSPPMERTPGEDSAEILASERSTSDGPRDPVSSSLRASFLEEADHLAAIDLTDQIAHLRQQARDAD